jgi:hypothetical protein
VKKSKNQSSKIISYLEFKLNKELAYVDTFEKDDVIRNEYKKYVIEMTELTDEHFEIIDRNRAREHEKMKKKDKERFDKLKQIGCIACAKRGLFSEPIIHHIRKHTGLSLRPPHTDTIPLCPQHHNMGNESVHLNKKVFIALFGTEHELLEEANEKIKQLEKEDIFYDKGNE